MNKKIDFLFVLCYYTLCIFIFRRRKDFFMRHNYLVTVLTTQIFDGDKDVIEMTTHADLELSEEGYILSYSEHSQEEGEIKTVISVDRKNIISVSREASINSCYTIEEGVRHLSHHVAPFGSFSVGISAKSVESVMTEEGGRLDFRYITDISGQAAGEVEFNIRVTRKS